MGIIKRGLNEELVEITAKREVEEKEKLVSGEARILRRRQGNVKEKEPAKRSRNARKRQTEQVIAKKASGETQQKCSFPCHFTLCPQ